MIGGLLGILALVLFAPILAALAMKFGPSEYFLLAIFGRSIVSTTARGQALKGLIAAGVGLMISFIGLFAVSQILDFSSEHGAISRAGVQGKIWEGVRLTFRHWKTLVKSCGIGILFGFAPGVGTTAASMVA